MKRRLIFIAIENFNREYMGKKILAEEIVAKGFKVLLAHKYIISTLIKILPIKGQIYIDKGVVKGSGIRVERAKRKGLNIYSFDEEASKYLRGSK